MGDHLRWCLGPERCSRDMQTAWLQTSLASLQKRLSWPRKRTNLAWRFGLLREWEKSPRLQASRMGKAWLHAWTRRQREVYIWLFHHSASGWIPQLWPRWSFSWRPMGHYLWSHLGHQWCKSRLPSARFQRCDLCTSRRSIRTRLRSHPKKPCLLRGERRIFAGLPTLSISSLLALWRCKCCLS